jgi:replication-associated recombination protein RarA
MKIGTFDFPERLTERFRPQTIDDFAGIARPKAIIRTFLRQPRPDGFLFLGPSGRGKTTMAYAMQLALNAELHKVPSKDCDMETIERLTRICQYAPFDFTGGKATGWHLVLIEEADGMTSAAQFKLLSVLDDTGFPPKTVFIFTANSTATFEARFLSRLKTIKFDDEGMAEEIPSYLARIAKKVGFKGKLNFGEIALATGYNIRDAINRLELDMMGGNYLTHVGKKRNGKGKHHMHQCPTCNQEWPHDEADCKLRYRAMCVGCGGTLTVHSDGALKGWETRRAKATKVTAIRKRSVA